MRDEPLPDHNGRLPRWLLGIWALALLLTVALAFDLSPWLRGDTDWRWSYLPYLAPARVLAVGAALTLYIATAAQLWRWALTGDVGRRARWGVGFAALAGLAIQIVVQFVSDADPWREVLLRTNSPFLAGFWNAATDVTNVGDFLRHFPEIAADYAVPHIQRHPPGLILYFVALQRLFVQFPVATAFVVDRLRLYRCEYWPLLYVVTDVQYAATVGGFLSPLLNVLGVWPLYAVGRRILGERAALAATLLSPLAPGYVVWAGYWDQAFVLVTGILLWLLYLALVERRHWAWWAAGALLSVGTFFTHAMLVLIGFAGFYTLLHLWLAREFWLAHWRQTLLNGTGFVIGLSSVWLTYWLAFGVTYLDVFRANTTTHFEMATTYLLRLFYNPYDFALFLGYVLGLLALVALWQVGRARAARQPMSPARTLVMAFGLTMAALVVSGSSRAEVGRVWVFLMPLAVLSAFAVEGGPAHSTGRWVATAAIVALQLIVLQVIVFTDRAVNHVYEMSASATPVGTRVGDFAELAGYEVNTGQLRPGDMLNLTLYWRVLRPPPGDYTVFAHLYAKELGVAALRDSPPRDGQYPTSCWQLGEIVSHNAPLATTPDTAPGVYELIVGLYDPAAKNQRFATIGPGARDLSIVLTEIQIVPNQP